jgi:hypothetical protein
VNKLVPVVGALLLAGCPKKSAEPPPQTAATCDNVGASIATQLAEDVKASPDPDPNADAINQGVVAAVVESCTKDSWSAAARACFIDARAEGESKCRNEVTDAQVQALEDRMDSAVAKVAPAACAELAPLIVSSLATDIDQAAPAERDALRAKIDTFATSIGTQCAAGWSAEARTCVRDSTRAHADPGRCARWLDDTQRAQYQSSVEAAFGTPPPESPAPAPAPAP